MYDTFKNGGGLSTFGSIRFSAGSTDHRRSSCQCIRTQSSGFRDRKRNASGGGFRIYETDSDWPTITRGFVRSIGNGYKSSGKLGFRLYVTSRYGLFRKYGTNTFGSRSAFNPDGEESRSMAKMRKAKNGDMKALEYLSRNKRNLPRSIQ